VSDYKVKSVTTLSALRENAVPGDDLNLRHSSGDSINKNESDGGKISSSVDDMVLLMERTPKIISLFQELAPESTLVGFKLQDNVSLETLIDKGFEVLTKNKCSFVLANDLKDITQSGHVGYLIDKDKNFTKYATKTEIADAIVTHTLK
jgi:phosphopantothenate-cysteine ligase